jgi:sigma-B regulation protein RsbU (phosphoserine phosphatase)
MLQNSPHHHELVKSQLPDSINQIFAHWEKISNEPGKAIGTRSLQQVVQIVVDLVKAQDGSLFLFDENQRLKTSVLTDKIDPLAESILLDDKLILESILDEGLAQWVINNCQIGLVEDTVTDKRWVHLPYQSYLVRSALCFPLFSGPQLLAIITLQHPEPNYFSQKNIEQIETCSSILSLFVEIAALQIEKKAAQFQYKLFDNLVEVTRASLKGDFLHLVLQKTLDLVSDLSGATKGSMFLLDPQTQKIIDTIISRQELSQKSKQELVGKVCDFGLAGWVIENRQMAWIDDVDEDPRWMKLPNDPSLTKSALAVPIIRSEEVLGIFTLEHTRSEFFTREITNLIQSTADQIALVLENLQLYYKVDQYASALNQELQKGRQMQDNFLPSDIIQPPNWEIKAFLSPAKDLAGDFYDIFPLENYIGLVIADVCDKGVGSAMFMGLMRSLIRIYSHKTYLGGFSSSELGNQVDTLLINGTEVDIAQISGLEAVKLTNEYVANNHWEVSMFATLFFGVLNPHNGILTYINGGHEALYIIRDGKIVNSLDSTGPAVGMMPNRKFSIEQVQLQPGDILFGYTDGVTDGKNINNELFSRDRLIPLLEVPVDSASELLERVKQNLFNHIGSAAQFDDITILSVKRLA